MISPWLIAASSMAFLTTHAGDPRLNVQLHPFPECSFKNNPPAVWMSNTHFICAGPEQTLGSSTVLACPPALSSISIVGVSSAKAAGPVLIASSGPLASPVA